MHSKTELGKDEKKLQKLVGSFPRDAPTLQKEE